MEKKNTGLVIFVTVLVMLVLVLVGYIVYDKAFNDKNAGLSDASKDTKEEINYSEVNDLVVSLRYIFDKTHGYYFDGIFNAYCGEAKSTDKMHTSGNNYLESTQFITYNEMYNYLRQYMSEDVIKTGTANDKSFYLEENGKLYCQTFGKGSAMNFSDTKFEIKSITDSKITAVASFVEGMDATYDTFGKDTKEIHEYYMIDLVFEKENNNWIVTSYKEKNVTSIYYNED